MIESTKCNTCYQCECGYYTYKIMTLVQHKEKFGH